MIAYFNGDFLSDDQVHIDPNDRGFLFSDGLYEAIRSYDGRLFKVEEHRRRLLHGIEALRFDQDFVPDIRSIAEELLMRNRLEDAGDAFLYFQITRGVAPRSHAFPMKGSPLTVYAYARPLTSKMEEQEKGIEAVTTPDIRWSRCDVKTIALLPNTLAHQSALDAGASEAVFIRDGFVQEGSHSNLFIVQNGVVKTPPLTNYVLAGITRRSVLDLCRSLGVESREAAISLDDFYAADEMWMTGTTSEITPIISVDGKRIGDGVPGDATRTLQTSFRDMTKNF
ncbi:MAG: aminotransferase class IV [Candidatus Omnitrophica bacterium]|nr:aminotransferase class IV [Candidatus Omnitrophota bacterium]